MQSSLESCTISDESYCSPWDLKIQEEKFKLLNEQRPISTFQPSSTINQSLNHGQLNKVFHRTCSVRTSSTKNFFIPRELSPPTRPPLPPGGLIPSCQCNTNNSINEISDSSLKKISNTDVSHNFLFTSTSSSSSNKINADNTQSMPFEAVLLHFKHLSVSNENNSSSSKNQITYEKPWDTLKTSFIDNFLPKNTRRGGSLQKLSHTETVKQHCSSPTFPVIQYTEDLTTLPIDRYFWYHYTMSRRQAENILQSRPSGSFLVRQSESGNQNDYSLSIKTTTNCVHMRICYSNGFYILGECSRPFLSVSSMIKYFSHTSVPIRGAPHIKLSTPILRWEILSSSLSNEEIL